MCKAASLFEGVHNFRNFCKMDRSKPDTPYVRSVSSAYVQILGQEDTPPLSDQDLPTLSADPNQFYVFVITGKAFLWHQVRCLMSVLYLVGLNLEPPSIVSRLMEPDQCAVGIGRPIYDLAPEIPLVLVETMFPQGTFDWRLGPWGKVGLKTILPLSTTLDPYIIKLAKPLYQLWRDHATRATQTMALIHTLLPLPQEFETLEESRKRWLTELVKGSDPMLGWPLTERSSTTVFQGCTRDTYNPLLSRTRHLGER